MDTGDHIFDDQGLSGDDLRKAGRWLEAAQRYEQDCADEIPPARTCLSIARCLHEGGNPDAAWRWLARAVDGGDAFIDWRSAAAQLDALAKVSPPSWTRRTVRGWLCGTYTTVQLAPLLRLAALREGVWLELGEGSYGQYVQEILDPGSALYAHKPDVVILATHAAAANLPAFSDQPDAVVTAEVERWVGLWQTLIANSGARLVMHNFAAPADDAFGHLAAQLPGSRASLLSALNRALGEAAAANGVGLVDCERLSAAVGKRTWFDARYYHSSKLAVSLGAHPLLARHTAAVMAASLGLSRKCLVLDLDNTLWGGVVGEDGVGGVRIGAGDAAGEAFSAFQHYIKALQQRGVVLAVCSKNEDKDARAPFTERADMVLKLDDFAAFEANWQAKPDNLKRIAESLNLGLDAFVFVDDNPVERTLMRQALPQVEVPVLPPDAAGYIEALAGVLSLEPASFTVEDSQRTAQYRSRAEAQKLGAEATSLDAFRQSLDMEAVLAPIGEADMARVVQLLGKTNQFNLTSRRHSEGQLRAVLALPGAQGFTLRLSDKFADHGLVGVIVGRPDGAVLEIDTFLMSCRVIGREAEAEMLDVLRDAAIAAGFGALRGVYLPTGRNGQVAELYARFGFEAAGAIEGGEAWLHDLGRDSRWISGFIRRADTPSLKPE